MICMMVCVYQVLMARIVYLTPLGVASLLALLMVQKDIQPLLSIFGLVFYYYHYSLLAVANIFFRSVSCSVIFAVLQCKLLLFLAFEIFYWIPREKKRACKVSMIL
jgi:hypothetical protein